MTLPAFDPVRVKARLARLEGSRQLAFGVLCCERLLPNYLEFQKDANWGDFHTVRGALDLVIALVSGKPRDEREVRGASEACESVAPSSDDFDSLFVTSAQDACFSVCSLLDFVLLEDVDRIVQTATYATDSVDLYVQEVLEMKPDDPALEKKILSHSLMQQELLRQEADLSAIEQAALISPGFLRERMASWGWDGKGNLSLSLSP